MSTESLELTVTRCKNPRFVQCGGYVAHVIQWFNTGHPFIGFREGDEFDYMNPDDVPQEIYKALIAALPDTKEEHDLWLA